jgi:Domain of unknown function (DUF5118)
MNTVRRLAYALTVAILPWALAAQEPTGTGTGTAQEGGFGGRGGRAPELEIRPYERVITKDAKSDEGIFMVHRIKDRIYYEIPRSVWAEFLWVSQIAKTTLGAGYGGQAAGNRVVKWERRGDRILLRAVSYDVIADPSTTLATPSFAGCRRPSRTRRDRTSTIHAAVRFSRPTSSSTTTS